MSYLELQVDRLAVAHVVVALVDAPAVLAGLQRLPEDGRVAPRVVLDVADHGHRPLLDGVREVDLLGGVRAAGLHGALEAPVGGTGRLISCMNKIRSFNNPQVSESER